jgi:hypothetical protein
MFLEAVQNFPLIAGFMGGLSLWNRSLWLAFTCMVAGSVLSALSMIPTEKRIFEGHRESARAVITNVGVFSILMFGFGAYVRAGWSNWHTDVVGGLIAGAMLGAAQDLAAGEPVGFARMSALGLSCAISLLVIRWVLQMWPPLVGIVVVTVWFTLVMGAYKLWRKACDASAAAE